MIRRYSVQKTYAEGSQSRVFLATDCLTGDSCILKKGPGVADEAVLALELNHPYILQPFDFGRDSDGNQYAAYHWVQAPSLMEWIRAGAGETELTRVALQIAETLCFLHHHHYLYNDFKPEHFLVLDSDIRIIDLGLVSSGTGDSESTFSGTFPYISPERLAGRAFDQRSDLFAFGMMLLHLFHPSEEWNLPPEVRTLQQLQNKTRQLPGFWQSILTEMTALEPNQRMESAAELWKRLLPEYAKGTFLILPPFRPFKDILDFSSSVPVKFVLSPSDLMLQQARNQAMIQSYKTDQRLFHFDFRHRTLSDAFINLLSCLSDERATDFLNAVDRLSGLRLSQQRSTLVISGAESLSSSERSSLSYAISRLAQSQLFTILAFAPRVCLEIPEDAFQQIELPVLTRQNLSHWLRDVLPAENSGSPALEFPQDSFLPEQAFQLLRRDFPPKALWLWPAPAKHSTASATPENVTTQEMRVLACLAVAGGALSRAALHLALPFKDPEQKRLLIEQLRVSGYIHEQQNQYFLALPASEILHRLRKDRIRDVARGLLSTIANDCDEASLFQIAVFARRRRTAAVIALSAARKAGEGHHDAAMEWYWRAHQCGAVIPKTLLLRLIAHSLRQAHVIRSRRLLKFVRRKFGMSYRLADLHLELDHRTNRLQEAENRLHKIFDHSRNKKHSRAEQYFTARLIFFKQLQLDFPAVEALSHSLLQTPCSEAVRGLVFHNLAVVSFYKGQLPQAVRLLHKAIRAAHPLRFISYITLGVTLTRLNHFDVAEKWLNKAIRIFNRKGDTDRLSIALLNLGNIYKISGDLKRARACYYQSLQLSRANRNQRMYCANLNNIAGTFQFEGRYDRATRQYARAARAAERAGVLNTYAISRANAGILYAYQGRFRKAISSLSEAITRYKELGLNVELAEAYEYLGIAYYLARKLSRAEMYLKNAERIFSECGAENSRLRMQLLIALVWSRNGNCDKSRRLLDQFRQAPEQGLEKGLYHYICALHELDSDGESSHLACREALHEAERVFRNIPSAFWLAKTYQLKAEYHMRKEHLEKASIAWNSAFNIFSRLGARKELLRLSNYKSAMELSEDFINRMAERLPYRILLMIKDILSETNPEVMISKILSVSLDFTDMERAVLILMEEEPRIFRSTSIDDSTVQDIFEISKSAVDAAADSRKLYVALDAGTDPYLKAKPSIIASRIMSVVCLPLRVEGNLIGMLYLDSREGVETLGKTEAVLLEIFASLVALVLNKTLILERSLAENSQLRSSLGLPAFPEIIGSSDAMMKVLRSVHQLLNTELPVLITGETGTGKELIARVLHYCGARKDGSFIAVNCSALSKSLLESELFGHEKGAFTGATATKKGLFEQAKGGTLFLDEIGDMPHSMQAKLLRVLQEGEFRRVGGNQTLHSNARIILATNRNLHLMVQKERFREDLYYRIKAVQIHLPPLRERPQDISLLATHFLKTSLLAKQKKLIGFTPEALDLLKRYHWPGNVRQLKNETDRIIAFTETEWIRPEDLDPEIPATNSHAEPRRITTLREREKEIIVEALEQHNWNIVQTARALGLTRNGLYGKMKMHGVRKTVS